MMQQNWQIRSEVVFFRLGPVRFFEIAIKALTLQSNPFVIGPNLPIPLSAARAKGCRAVVVPALPVDKEYPTMCIDGAALRYVARYGKRYVVDLQGSFAEYLKKFSKKSRGNLQRAVKKFACKDTGLATVHEYRSSSEIREFRDIAVAISHLSYKKELGWGFQESEQFARQLELEAAAGRVRGYVLMCGDEAAAYVFCRIDHDVIIYKHIGYNPQFAQKSPGTALLYLVLRRLFSEGQLRLVDFDGTEYYPYKEFFSTRAVRCARVFWFRPRLPELALFHAHWMLTSVWRLSSVLRRSLWQGQSRWGSCRMQQKQSSLRWRGGCQADSATRKPR